MTQARDKANIPVLNFASKGIDDNADATAITINSSEQVAIGTTSHSSGANITLSGQGFGTVGADSGSIAFGSNTSYQGRIYQDNNTSDFFIENTYSSGEIAFKTNSSEKMRLTSTGLGIGTASPSTKLTIVEGGEPPASGMLLLQANSTQRQLRIQPPTNADNGFIDFRGGNLTFLDDGTEVARFQSGGKFGIGNSAPLTKLDVQASADNEDLIRLSHPSSPANAGALLGFNSDGTTDNNVITLGVHYSNDFYDVLNIQRSTRNVGIGTVNPQEQLDITSNVPRIRFTDLSVTNLRHVIGSEANDLEIRCDDGNVQATSHIGFKIDGSEKVRMTDNGRVGIGTSSPSATLHVDNSGGASVQISRTGSGALYLESDGTNGNIRSTSSSGSLAFQTNGNNERMRIDSSGNLLVGTTSITGTGGFIFQPNLDDGAGRLIFDRVATTASSIVIEFENGNNRVGEIQYNDTTTAYVTSSDYRLKENVSYDFDATTRIKQLKPARFNFIINPNKTVDGFLAHEVQSVIPEAITGEKDAMKTEEYEVTPAVLDEDGNVITEAVMGTREVPDYQGIDQAKLVPLLVKTIQELEARITALETTTP